MAWQRCLRWGVWGIILGGVVCGGEALGGDDPGQLPLLKANQASGMMYTTVDPAGQSAVDQAWGALVHAGLDMYDLSVGWAYLVNPDGSPNYQDWLGLIDDLQAGGLQTYFLIPTIDTNNLQLPRIFTDPSNERELADGMSFDSPILVEHFGLLLDALVPELVVRDVFCISVGNEVDVWLLDHPEQIVPFARFVQAARERVHAIEPRMSVGVALTSEVPPKISGMILASSDIAAFTYYPIGPGNLDVRDPSVIGEDLDKLLAIAGDKQVILQEIGYPSGWAQSGINSSVEKQREFVERMFPALAARPQIRAWSFLHLGDWGEDTLAVFEEYYGISIPEFLEFLGTLGLHWNDGTAKPAYIEFLKGLKGLKGIELHRIDAVEAKERQPFP